MSVHGTVGYGIAVCLLADFPDIEVAGFGQSAAYYDALRAEDVDESGDAVSQEVAMLVQALRCQLVSFFVEAYDKLSVDSSPGNEMPASAARLLKRRTSAEVEA